MVASPFAEIEVRLAVLEDARRWNAKTFSVVSERITNEHRCIEALVKRIESLERSDAQQIELNEQQTTINERLLTLLERKG